MGAMPGKIIQCLKKTKTENPLVLIDEVRAGLARRSPEMPAAGSLAQGASVTLALMGTVSLLPLAVLVRGTGVGQSASYQLPSPTPGGQDRPGLPGGPLVSPAGAAGPGAERQLPGPLPGRARGPVQGACPTAWGSQGGGWPVPLEWQHLVTFPRCCSSARPMSPRPSPSR